MFSNNSAYQRSRLEPRTHSVARAQLRSCWSNNATAQSKGNQGRRHAIINGPPTFFSNHRSPSAG